MTTRPKRPRDTNQLAKLIVGLSTGEVSDAQTEPLPKNQAAVELGRLGGLKGGAARAKAMTKKERSLSAQKAAKARWSK